MPATRLLLLLLAAGVVLTTAPAPSTEPPPPPTAASAAVSAPPASSHADAAGVRATADRSAAPPALPDRDPQGGAGGALLRTEPLALPCAPAGLRLRAEIDRHLLRETGAAPLRLVLEGTGAPVAVRLRNDTPAAVSLAGGDDQVATSSGGSPNTLERELEVQRGGAFDIRYALAGSPCPSRDSRAPR